MATMKIDFEWTRGYEYKVADGKICQVGTRQERSRPLEERGDLYLIFANLDASPGACASFAQNYGLLATPAHRGAAESLDIWQREIKNMKAWLVRDQKHFRVAGRIRAKLTSIDVSLEYEMPDTKPILRLWPTTLSGAMLLQFAQQQASGKTTATCEYCGQWFEVGSAAKRRVAKFCSDEHRNRYHYERRAKQ